MSRVRQICETELWRFLERYGNAIPALTRVEIEIAAPHHPRRYGPGPDVLFECWFSNGQRLSWFTPNEFGHNYLEPRLIDQTISELHSLYSRIAEDWLIRTDTRRAMSALERMEAQGAPPDQIQDIRARINQAVAHQSRHHAGVAAPPVTTSNLVAAFSGRSLSHVVVDELAELPSTPEGARIMEELRQHLDRQMVAAFGMDRGALGGDQTAYFTSGPGGITWMGVGGDVGTPEANSRGLALLREWLSPEQLAQYDRDKLFDVIGSDTGKRYRIRHGRQMNIDELDADGRKVCGWCFLPEGQLVAGDVMLAQKIALETFEKKALKKANRFELEELRPWEPRFHVVEERPSRRWLEGSWDMSLRPGAVNVVVSDPTA